MKLVVFAILAYLVAPLSTAHADEVEYMIYDDVLGVDLAKGQTATPATTLPLTFSVLANGGQAKVERQTKVGYLRICLLYRGVSTDPWSKLCIDADNSGEALKGVQWNDDGNIALALYVDSTANYSSSYELDSSNLPGSATSCSASCDDGSSCTATCPNGCLSHCAPASCGCGQ